MAGDMVVMHGISVCLSLQSNVYRLDISISIASCRTTFMKDCSASKEENRLLYLLLLLMGGNSDKNCDIQVQRIKEL
jgi:hypothetical protein